MAKTAAVLSNSHPPLRTVHLKFQGTGVNDAQISISSPDQPRNEPPMTISYGVRKYKVASSTLRGRWRRQIAVEVYDKLREIDPNFKYTVDEARLAISGGVKGSDASVHLNPRQTETIRAMRPDLDALGMSDPVFFGGRLNMGHMISQQPALYENGKPAPSTILPIVRRALVNDTLVTTDFVSDLEKLTEYAAMNRERSKLEATIKTLRRLEGRATRTPKEEATYRTTLDELGAEIGIPFANAGEVDGYLSQFKTTMREGGHSDVSDANLQSIAVIPAGVIFDHKFYLPNITRAGAGLLLTEWHNNMIINPVIGGLAARGCGGYITATYKVQRRVDLTWIDDCTVTSTPDTGLTFTNDSDSEVRRLLDEWEGVDIRQFEFAYGALLKVIRGEPKGDTNGG